MFSSSSQERDEQTKADLYGAMRLCPDSVVAWGKKKAEELQVVAARICELWLELRAHVRNGLSRRRQRPLAAYRLDGRPDLVSGVGQRGALPKGFRGGVVVHDHFKPYYALPGVRHEMCNAHHLRELKALIDIDKERWAGKKRDLLEEENEDVRSDKDEGATTLLTLVLRTRSNATTTSTGAGSPTIETCRPSPDRSDSRRSTHRPGHNLLIRLHKFKSDVLRFLYDFTFPFTNN